MLLPNGDTILGNTTPVRDAFDEATARLDEDKQPVIDAFSAIEGSYWRHNTTL